MSRPPVIIAAVLSAAMLLSSCGAAYAAASASNRTESKTVFSQKTEAAQPSEPTSSTQTADADTQSVKDEVRALWITYSELGTAFQSGNFKSAFDKMMDDCVGLGINTVYVHVRAFCDSFYPSDIFPWSKYAFDSNGRAPDFDPLEYMIKSAHSRSIGFHAWINPYRVSHTSSDFSKLSSDSPVTEWLSDDDSTNDDWAVAAEEGIYLDPAAEGVRRLVLDGVREIVDKYPLDGIHFDDYFYPTADESFDEGTYAAYRAAVSSHTMPLDDWRRANVNAMVASVSACVRGKGLVFGISPAANLELNYNEIYADVYTWLDNGYLDYIIPQIYYGFNYPVDKYSYGSLLDEWVKLVNRRVPIYIGLGAYRIGDSKAAGGEEWCDPDTRVLADQITALRESRCDGFCIFSYDSIMNDSSLATGERQAVQSLLSKSGDIK